jgi:fumarate hydratase subunit beta
MGMLNFMSEHQHLHLPLSDDDVLSLHAGDMIYLSGDILTARDAAHKYMVEQLIKGPNSSEAKLHAELKQILARGALYHCGPVTQRVNDQWHILSAGPTTSMREEIYEHLVMKHFDVSAIIGKGGMGEQTLAACRQVPAVYLHAPGGCAAYIASHITKVVNVYKLEFGSPEAMWHIQINDLPLMVTMDAHGISWHQIVAEHSASAYQEGRG